jgi:hypothetical protein
LFRCHRHGRRHQIYATGEKHSAGLNHRTFITLEGRVLCVRRQQGDSQAVPYRRYETFGCNVDFRKHAKCADGRKLHRILSAFGLARRAQWTR